MAQVTLYQPNIRPSGGTEAKLRPADFSANIGSGLEAAGQAMERQVQTALTQAERQRDVDRFRYSADFLELTQQVTGRVMGLRGNLPEGGAGHLERASEMAQGMTAPFLEAIADPVLREEFTARQAGLLASVMSGEQTFVAGARRHSMGANYERASNRAANLILQDFRNVAQADTQMADLLNSLSGIPEESRTELRESWRQARDEAAARSLTRTDPDAAIAALTSGLIGGTLPTDRLDALIGQAESEKRRRDAEALRGRAVQRAGADQDVRMLDRRFEIGDNRLTDEDLERVRQRAAAAGLPAEAFDIGRYRLRLGLRREFGDAAPAEIEQAIGAIQQRMAAGGDSAGPEDGIRLAEMQTMLATRTRAVESAPLTAYRTAGGRVGPIDYEDGRSVQARIAAARAAEQQFGYFQVLEEPEAASLQERVRSGTNGRLAAIGMIAQIALVDRQAAEQAAMEVAPNDRVFRHAIRLDPAIRDMVVNGAEAYRQMPQPVVRGDGSASTFDAESRRWFMAQIAPQLRLQNAEHMEDVLAAARAYHAGAGQRAGAGAREAFDEAAFAAAVDIALGSAGRGGGTASWSYGPRRPDGRPHGFILPARLTERQFERRMEALPLARLGEHFPPGAAPNGRPVWSDRSAVAAHDIRNRFVPVMVSDGLYEFHYRGRVLGSESGRPFRLDVYLLPPAARGGDPVRED